MPNPPPVAILLAAMKSYEAIVIGAGVMGGAAAYELAKRGATVALIDQAMLPNPRGASVDHSKVFRFAYPEPLYARMAVDALALWRELEDKTGARFLTSTGLLLMGGDGSQFEAQSYEALRALNLDVETLGGAEVAVRYPQFDNAFITQAVFDPSGAITHAEDAVRALIHGAKAFGADVFEGERITAIEQNGGANVVRNASGNHWLGEKLIIASGPWTRNLLPELANRLTTTRQEVVYFKPVRNVESFAVGRFPIFLEMESGFYGFPIHHGGAIKVGNHLKGSVIDAAAPSEEVGEEFIKSCRRFFARLIPALADAQVQETRLCIYNNTPDDDFIIDWHPRHERALILTGFSGHGFKFGPLIGQIAADLLLGGERRYDLSRFCLGRFQNSSA